MGWISSAACALIATIFLYRYWTTGKQARSEKAHIGGDSGRSSTKGTKKEKVVQASSGNTIQPRPTIVHTAPCPSATITVSSHSPKMNKEQSTRPDDNTMSMRPPPAPLRSKSPPRLKPPAVGLAPTPPRPGGIGGAALRPPPSAAASLRVPPQRVLQNTSMQPAGAAATSLSVGSQNKKASKQVALEPGHSPMDWAALTNNPANNLRGKDAPASLSRITPSQLKSQNGRKDRDAWTVYQGKVYNISPYVPFHPGGKGEILRGAGKDSAKLFMEVHPWVNWDGMLAECMVGILVGEDESADDTNDLDEMD